MGRRQIGRATAPLRPLPEFLIVGAQRAGTTSLHRYLLQHPGVLGAGLTKGVHWFDESFDQPLSWYRAHFPTTLQRRLV
ncbi:MAG: sulfotransferase, partial [Acidimicrobiales bacterium]